jgi:hypothetical protein
MQECYIYILKSPNISTQYIGSTVKLLNRRFTNHKSPSNKTSSKIIIDSGNASIELYEIFNCDTKLELHKREEEVKQLLISQGVVFVNIRKSGIDAINNPEYIKEKNRVYRDLHKEQIQAYRDLHKEQQQLSQKSYRDLKKQLRNN